MANRPALEFWYEFASPYSYLSATRIAGLAEAAGIEILWRPFLLGPIFAAQGWPTSPFNLYPAKGRYMVRDMERLALARGRAFHLPASFPANGLVAARIALVGAQQGWVGDFSARVFQAEFERAADISDKAVLASCLEDIGIAAEPIIAKAQSEANKHALRQQSERAAELGLFGAPSFVTRDGELFWGDDRLQQAIAWAANNAPA